jgi:hypothetical protein
VYEDAMKELDEAELRDYLADHLDMVEAGLTLLKTEFLVPNAYGAKGFIDIFARDSLGNVVMIELKRSDASSRTALHELHKYIALLRAEHGLEAHSLRCMICSTEWLELLVPFSEFARSVSYSVDGLRLHLRDDGLPDRIERVEPVGTPPELMLCREAAMLFYEHLDEGSRAAAVEQMVHRAKQLGIVDYCLVLASKVANASRGVATHAIYVTIAKLSKEQKATLKAMPEFPLSTYLEGDRKWAYEQAAIECLVRGLHRDQFEIGYPEKLSELFKGQGWKLDGIERGGRYASELVRTAEQLFAELIGLSGTSEIWFASMSSPRLKSAWKKLTDDAGRALDGNKNWERAYRWFCDQTRRQAPNSSVSVSVFNPMRIVHTMWRCWAERTFSYVPAMELVRAIDGEAPTVYFGYIEWDGSTKPTNPESIISQACEAVFGDPSPEVLQWAAMTGEVCALDLPLMKLHGLRYSFAEIVHTPDGRPALRRLTLKVGKMQAGRVDHQPQLIHDFFAKNEDYMNDLAAFLDSQALMMRAGPSDE